MDCAARAFVRRFIWLSLVLSVANGSIALAGPPRSGACDGGARRPERVLETTNFRFHHALDAGAIEKLAASAEEWRQAFARDWRDGADPVRWNPKCDVFLYADPGEYSRMSGYATATLGSAQWLLDGDRVATRAIHLRADRWELVDAVLRHELTHLVLADWFAPRRIPKWADEGIAMVSESVERRARAHAVLSSMNGRQSLRSLADLFAGAGTVTGRSGEAFYAQSCAVTEFLIERRSKSEFIEFLQLAQRVGVEAALRRHYGIESVTSLETSWSAWRRDRSALLASGGTTTPRIGAESGGR